MKKVMWLIVFILMLFLGGMIIVSAEGNTLDVYFDGNTFDVKINGNPIPRKSGYGDFFIDIHTKLQTPLRWFLEHFGAKVDWNNDTKTATISLNGNVVEFTEGSYVYKINGKPNVMETVPIIKDERMYIPLENAAEALGYSVNFVYNFSDEGSTEENSNNSENGNNQGNQNNQNQENSNPNNTIGENGSGQADNNDNPSSNDNTNNSKPNSNDNSSNDSDTNTSSDSGTETNTDNNTNPQDQENNNSTDNGNNDNTSQNKDGGQENNDNTQKDDNGDKVIEAGKLEGGTIFEHAKRDLKEQFTPSGNAIRILEEKQRKLEDKTNELMNLMLKPLILFEFGIFFITSILVFIVLFMQLSYMPHFPTQRRKSIENIFTCIICTIFTGSGVILGILWDTFGSMVNNVMKYSKDYLLAFNDALTSYQRLAFGIFGFAALTMLLMLIINFVRLGLSAGNPQQRKEALIGIMLTGLGTAGLGGIAIWLGLFWNVLK